ncbi:MAG: RluA family pseudouridine synthase [Campylobacterales bacterium]
MGFVEREFLIEGEQKILKFLVEVVGLSPREGKRAIDRGRVSLNGKRVTNKGAVGKGILKCILFEPNGFGITPFFETPHFAIYDKPSGVPIHPKKLANTKSLLDDHRKLYGPGANLVHRLDRETSGLVIGSKYKYAESELKRSFQEREIQKEYLALIWGVLERGLEIKKPIEVNRDPAIKVKVQISPTGREAVTIVEPLEVVEGGVTLVRLKPLTGRQHQLRVHLWSIGHPIVGDPLYGVSPDVGDQYLRRVLPEQERIYWTGASRLLLHSYRLKFHFFGNRYNIISPTDFRGEIGRSLAPNWREIGKATGKL